MQDRTLQDFVGEIILGSESVPLAVLIRQQNLQAFVLCLWSSWE